MPLTETAALVDGARACGRGLAALNVITLEHAEAIVRAAESTGLPVVLQVSENAVKYHGGSATPLLSAALALARTAGVPVGVHLDHVRDRALLSEGVTAGVSSAMFDASGLAYASNVRTTAEAVRWAHGRGVWLEAELGEIGGKDGAHAPGARTDPAEAARFVADTGVDALAVAVGTSHAMTERTARLDHELIGRLREAVPVPLVLHGSSGVPDAELRLAVRAGMVKINVGTALNVAFTTELRRCLTENPSVVDPRTFLAPARAAMAAAAEHVLRVVAGSDDGAARGAAARERQERTAGGATRI
ncbi:class II fructose-bisphosphate aldolase [Streptomyces meridianus]|uniref:Class II fructose-bisphosphate aldolase family protein n=1 Tax=Streptomyces meridianus TaxID=2938945 RepID=A0ABT0XE83_9ACTN|nr:class II fructose-bisphosphate aldolase [Streptomyces meridianus]MCM2580082.1 class II fructose-bisphosphate aldolase family protein [Streptomyces meridianus]